MEPSLLNIIIGVASITYSVIFGVIAKKVMDVPSTIDRRLAVHEEKFIVRLDRIDKEAQIAHRRINVLDRISSKLAGKDFDSRAIAEQGQFPDIHPSL